MRNKPILFSTPMVLALLDDTKSMTRRVIEPKIAGEKLWEQWHHPQCPELIDSYGNVYKPQYQTGDRVWVRETWRVLAAYDERDALAIQYFAGGAIAEIAFTPERYEIFRKYTFKNGWNSPYFLPREAARIFRDVIGVRPEPLCDISTEDARREGVSIENWTQRGGDSSDESPFYREAFAELWDGLNAKRGFGWNSNPWVWAYALEKEAA